MTARGRDRRRAGSPRAGAPRSGTQRSAAPRPGAARPGAAGSGPPRTGARRRRTADEWSSEDRPRTPRRIGSDRTTRPADERPPLPRKAAGWGNVARRGARQVSQRDGEERTRDDSDERERERRRSAPKRKPVEKWTRDDGAREWADVGAPPRPRGRRPAAAVAAADDVVQFDPVKAIAGLSAKHALPPEIATDIRNAADIATACDREHLVDRAEAAYSAYERGRFQDALRAIKPVVDEAPGVAAVRELAGLAAYRCGRWRSAAGHLEAFGRLSDSAEHLPILMDCQRALHKPKKVAALWAELRQSSPDPDVLAEGRIVAAASLADSGDLNGAIAMLSTAGASKALRNPSERHVRQWYLLADLYERAGDVPKAREYFERVFRTDAEAYDVAERLRGLGPERRTQRRRPKTSDVDEGGPAHAPKRADAPVRSRRRCGGGDRRRGRRSRSSGGRGRRSRRSRSRRSRGRRGRRWSGRRGGRGRWRRPEVRPLDGHEGADGGERPDQSGVGVAHLDAAVALRGAVGGANEAVKRVATVEVAGVRDVRVVVGRAVDVGPLHVRVAHVLEHGEGAVRRVGARRPAVDRDPRVLGHAVVPERQALRAPPCSRGRRRRAWRRACR